MRLALTLLVVLAAATACSGNASRSNAAATSSPAPSLVYVSSKDILSGAWTATTAKTVRAELSHGPLHAEAIYPVVDSNSNSINATRFRVWDAAGTIADKLIDDMPQALHVITVEGGGEVVILDTFSGGAHCCASTALVDPRTREEPGFTTIDWRDLPYKLQVAPDGSGYIFLTADDAMAYAFSSFGNSTFPIKIFSYRGGRFTDVTNEFPTLVSADASTHWKEYLNDASSNAAPQAALVAYLADKYRLGTGDRAWTEVLAANGRDEAFEAKAKTWLEQNGYVRGQQK